MMPNQNHNSDAQIVGNDWRNNAIPIYQHFSAPSSTYINLFRQPGQYNIAISYDGNDNRTNSAISSMVPNHQTQATMTFGARVQTGGPECSMHPPSTVASRNQLTQTAVPPPPTAGNRDPSMIIPTPDYSSSEQGERQVVVSPLHIAANGFGGPVGNQPPPTSPKTL